jgi:hypothetical protein
MLNYYNPALTSWTDTGNAIWGWLIVGHILALMVPGFVAMFTEYPRLFGIGRHRPDNVTPLEPRRTDEFVQPHAA